MQKRINFLKEIIKALNIIKYHSVIMEDGTKRRIHLFPNIKSIYKLKWNGLRQNENLYLI